MYRCTMHTTCAQYTYAIEACAGSAVTSMAGKAVASIFSAVLKVNVEFETSWLCEKVEMKQTFEALVVPDVPIFADIKDLCFIRCRSVVVASVCRVALVVLVCIHVYVAAAISFANT